MTFFSNLSNTSRNRCNRSLSLLFSQQFFSNRLHFLEHTKSSKEQPSLSFDVRYNWLNQNQASGEDAPSFGWFPESVQNTNPNTEFAHNSFFMSSWHRIHKKVVASIWPNHLFMSTQNKKGTLLLRLSCVQIVQTSLLMKCNNYIVLLS